MVEHDYIDLRRLNLDELNGVVNLYPWFGGARKELCRRMSELGEGAWSDERYADAALYIGSRRIIAGLAHKGHKADYSDIIEQRQAWRTEINDLEAEDSTEE